MYKPDPTEPLEPIQTDFVYPPIPIRTSDWVAYRDPEMPGYGHGRTEAEAIASFLMNEDPPFYVLVDEKNGRVFPRIVHPDDYAAGEVAARIGGFVLADSGG